MTKELDKGIVLPFMTRLTPRVAREMGGTDDPILTVLVISDKPADRSAIRSALETEGFILQEAADGMIGLKLVTALLPDCILLDSSLADSGAHEIIGALHRSENRFPCSLLLLTSNRDGPLTKAAIAAGAQDFIVKEPLNYSGLSSALRMAARQFRLIERQTHAEQRNAHLAAIVTGSPDAILSVGLDSIVQSWNPAAEILFGYTEAEAVGRSVDELIVPPGSRAERMRTQKLARSGRPAHLKDAVRLHKTGAPRPVEVNAFPIVDASGAITGTSVIFRDIRDRKRDEEQQLRLEQLIAHSTDLIALADTKGRLTFLNRAGRRMIGAPEDGPVDDLRYPPTRFVAPSHRDVLRTNVLPTARREGLWEGELRLVNQSTGALIEAKCSIFAQHDNNGALTGFATVMRDVTSERHAAAGLQASEAFRRSVFEASPDCLQILSLDGRLEEMNANGQRLMEITDFEPFRGKLWSSFGPDSAAPAVERAVADARTGSATVRFTAFCPTAAGTPKWWDVCVNSVQGADGRNGYLIAASRDVTERKQAEAELRIARDSMRQLIESSPFGIYAVDADFKLVQISAGAQKVFCNVQPLLGRDFAEVLRVIWPEPFANELISRFRHTLQTGERYSAPGTVERRQDISEVEAYDWKIERVVLPDGRLGVVCHFYDLSERRQLEIQLLESQQRSQLALDAAQLGWWQYDPLTRITMWDERFRQIVGVADLQGDLASITGIVVGVDRPRVRDAVEAALDPVARRPFVGEFRIRWPDGTVRWVQANAIARFEGVNSDDPAFALVGTIKDVTARKRSEQALSDREAHLRLALEASGSVTFEWDVTAEQLMSLLADDPDWATTEEAGTALADHPFVHTIEHVHPDDRELFIANVLSALRSDDGIYRSEHRAIEPDGSIRWLAERGRTERDGMRQSVRLLGISHDITDRKNAEDQLRSSEQRYRSVIEAHTEFLCRFRADGTLTLVNDAYATAFERLPARLVGSSFFAFIPAEDRERVRTELARLTPQAPSTTVTHPVLGRDGSHRWFEWTHKLLPLDATGGEQYQATGRDVTARMVAETALRESEERFRTIFDTAQEGIWAIDNEDRTLLANPRLAEMLRVPMESIAGKPVSDFCFPEDALDYRERMASNFTGRKQDFEFRFRRGDGTPLFVLAGTAPLRGRNGEIVGLLGGFVDLSERKRSEERQRLMMRELTHRGKNLLAVIQSIAGRTLAGDRTLDEARDVFVGRLHALAQTYGTLTDEAFEGAPLDVIVSSELESFGERVVVSGPRIMLTAKIAQTFALVVHELTTNAAKYGALSGPTGELRVTWRLQGSDRDERFIFEWHENGGPRIKAPTRSSFGTALISSVAGSQLGCVPEISFREDGLVYRLDTLLSAVGAAVDDTPVRDKIQTETLRVFYDVWAGLRNAENWPPTLERFARQTFAPSGALTLAELGEGGKIHFLETGRALTERSGRLLMEGFPTPDDPHVLEEAYERCARLRAPSYEHLRFEFEDGHTINFERLLVPLTQGGNLVTHVAGLVVYSGTTHSAPFARGPGVTSTETATNEPSSR